MKKLPVLFLCIFMLFSLATCGGTGNGRAPGNQNGAAGAESQPEPPDTEKPEPKQPDSDGSNILIAYFTWADNTQVENPDAVDVDATTSASVLPPGNAAKIAGWIQERTGGDVFSIIVEEPYSSDYDECLDRAADEKAENARPALVSHIENIDQYDTVFLGFPNWCERTGVHHSLLLNRRLTQRKLLLAHRVPKRHSIFFLKSGCILKSVHSLKDVRGNCPCQRL